MNLSIHLPQPLLVDLDNFAKKHKLSRSGIVRDAVSAYLMQKQRSAWPADLRAWMQAGLKPRFQAAPDDGPDLEAIRQDANAGWQAQTAAVLKDLDA